MSIPKWVWVCIKNWACLKFFSMLEPNFEETDGRGTNHFQTHFKNDWKLPTGFTQVQLNQLEHPEKSGKPNEARRFPSFSDCLKTVVQRAVSQNYRLIIVRKLLLFTFLLKSLTDFSWHQCHVEYLFKFFDKEGIPIKSTLLELLSENYQPLFRFVGLVMGIVNISG